MKNFHERLKAVKRNFGLFFVTRNHQRLLFTVGYGKQSIFIELTLLLYYIEFFNLVKKVKYSFPLSIYLGHVEIHICNFLFSYKKNLIAT